MVPRGVYMSILVSLGRLLVFPVNWLLPYESEIIYLEIADSQLVRSFFFFPDLHIVIFFL